MSLHLQKSIEKLKRRILAVSALAEESFYLAVRAIEERDAVLARKVIEADGRLDEEEVDVEEECLKILALHQPVALDLRFIVSVLKINSDLERIGDMAVNIAERAVYLATKVKVITTFDFPGMTEKTRTMLRNSLDSLVNRDPELARKVIAADDEVDMMNRHMYDQIKKAISGKRDDTNALLHLLSVSRHLERIADHATNIAEDVIYMVEGKIVRHKSETYGQPSNAVEEE